MWSVLHSGNSQPGSSEDSIGDAMPTEFSSASASDNVIDIGSIVDGSVDLIISSQRSPQIPLKKKKKEFISQEVKEESKEEKTLGLLNFVSCSWICPWYVCVYICLCM